MTHWRAWPQAETDFLILRVTAGDSAGMIMKKLNREFNFPVTRNAVIGKIHRMQDKDKTTPRLAGRPVDGGERYGVKRATKKRDNSYLVRRRTHSEESRTRSNIRAAEISAALAANKGVELPPDSNPVDIFNLDHDGCREVIDPTPYRQMFCNAKQAAGSSYCALHHAKNHAGVWRLQDKDAAE